MLVRLVQPPKAPVPILVTLLGILMLVIPVQPWNALSPMLVTLSGIMIKVTEEFPQPKTGGYSLPTFTTGKAFTEVGIVTAPPAPV